MSITINIGVKPVLLGSMGWVGARRRVGLKGAAAGCGRVKAGLLYRNMSSENISSENASSDPRTLRAVAHPVRLDIIHLLHLEGPLTASRCAEALGLTPKVCSYHLNLLAKYGLVEETGEGKGRARPWRLVRTQLEYVARPDESEEMSGAAHQYAKTMLGRDVRQIEAFIDHRDGLPPNWRNVSTMASNPLCLGPRQLKAMGEELMEVLERYREVEPDDDAHAVQLSLYAIPTGVTDLIT